LIHILIVNIVLIISWETHHPKLVVVGVVHLQKKQEGETEEVEETEKHRSRRATEKTEKD
jgi:hypothetical protein